MKATILITTFMRDNLLKYGLASLTKQDLTDTQILVLDEGINNDAKKITDAFGVDYLRTNPSATAKWRIPGFAFNIGAKKAKGDILVLACAEMLHLNNTVAAILSPFSSQEKIMSIPYGKHDSHGKYLKELESTGQTPNQDTYDSLNDLNTKFPFFLAVKREAYIEIGGYDEDFRGLAYDDADFVDRLVDSGFKYVQTEGKVVHLWHSKVEGLRQDNYNFKFNLNKTLYYAKKGIIKRNLGREWGVLKNEDNDDSRH